MEPKNAQEAAQQSMARHNARSLAGMTLTNASGDIDMTSAGYQIAMDTLTWIRKKVVAQKFYEIPIADYLPVAVGEGSFSQSLLTNLTVDVAGDFESGNLNQGSANDRLAGADAAISSKTIKIVNWAKATGYSLFELEQGLRYNNWDIIEARHRSRKKNWDLGIQQIAFLGSASDPGVLGLLTQTTVNSDTTTITKLISDMSATEFAAFAADIIEAFRANCARTAQPTHFIIPEDDWNGLGTPLNTANPLFSKLDYLMKLFAQIVPGGMKILPLAYAMPTYNSDFGVNKHRYTMLRYDEETVRMDIPVDFTPTAANSINNFQFQDAAYGQYAGPAVYRPLEVLYFDF